ncbi:hypothetical protein ACFY7H_24420 [Streptomyces sp. NPDC012794]|uniref:hypothetical protein n=1 Tax=Streptomyces sp. NPDC012794 TaxID=3364850 RepID=UPI0036844BD4
MYAQQQLVLLLMGLVGDLQDRIARPGAVPDAEQRTATQALLARAEREGVLLQERLARLRLLRRPRTRCRR